MTKILRGLRSACMMLAVVAAATGNLACSTATSDDDYSPTKTMVVQYDQETGATVSEISPSLPSCMWQYHEMEVGAATEGIDRMGQPFFQPGMVEVTGEVGIAANAAGVVVDPETVAVIYYPNELVPRPAGMQCPDGSPPSTDPDFHYNWQAWQDRVPAGLSYYHPACGQPGKWFLMNWSKSPVKISGCLIHPGSIQTPNGLIPPPFLWPFDVQMGKATEQTMIDPTTGETRTFIQPFAVWKTKEFEDALAAAGVASNPTGTYADYGKQPAGALFGTMCPDGNPLPSPVGWNYNWSVQPLPPRTGFSYAAPLCGNPHGWNFCNMHTDKEVWLKGRVVVF